MLQFKQIKIVLCLSVLLSVGIVACAASDNDAGNLPTAEVSAEAAKLVIYSGRNENLVGPLIEQYREETGVNVEVRYGGTAEMAAVILEEGTNSPADLFFGQDAGSLGALNKAGRCVVLPEEITNQVDPRFVSPDKSWIGISARARVLVYNTDELTEADLPKSVLDLTDPQWKGRVGWAPTNASFQSFITAMRVNLGEDETRQWLEGMINNDVQLYSSNSTIVEATGSGELSAGLVNHYYLLRYLAEQPDFPVANYFFPAGDLGAMINIAGACVLNTAPEHDAAIAFTAFLLSDDAQSYFAQETFEYPLTDADIELFPGLKPLAEIDTPEFDLSDIDDLAGTVELLTQVGAFDQ